MYKNSTISNTIRIFISFFIVTSCQVEDNRVQDAKEELNKMISYSEGSVELLDFNKTNSIEGEMMGIKTYVLEWEASIKIVNDIWKSGDIIEGYWNDFHVLKQKPGGYEGFLAGAPKHYSKDTKILLNGNSTFEKTEKGWRLTHSEITKSRLINGDNQLKTSSNENASQLSDQFTGNWVENTSNPRFVKRILKISGTSKNQYSITFYSEGLDSKEGPWKGSFRKSDETTLWSENMELSSPDDPPGLTNTYNATIFLKDDILFFKYLNGYECQLKKQ